MTNRAGRAESPGGGNWYEKSFYLLHEDHHTRGGWEVGRDADPERTAELIALSRPDVIQIHAKGNPGWTTYPSEIGYTPPKLARDVLGVWRDIARRDGYHFSAYYNIGRDGEIMEHKSQWNRQKANGEPYVRKLCYHSGVAEEYLWPMVKEIMEDYQPDGFWFDGSVFTVDVCYCEKCRERFRQEYDMEAPEGPNSPGWAAYREMQRQIYREFVRDTAAMVHQLDPDCLVAVNWAYSLRMPEEPDENVGYLTGDIGNRVEGLSAEAHWYDSQGRPFDLMTRIYTRPEGPKPPEQIEQEMAIIIANGGRYFAWDAPSRESGLDATRMEFLGEVVAPFLREREEWCLGSRRVADVSLLHSAAAHYAATASSVHCFEKEDIRIDSACQELFRAHLNYEMVPDWRLEEQEIESPVLIVEHPAALAEGATQSFREYVSSGGTLLLTGMGITHGDDILDLCGVEEVIDSDEPEEVVISGLEPSLRTYDWFYRATSGKGEVVVEAQDGEGERWPLLIRNRVGEGEVLYAAIPLLTMQPMPLGEGFCSHGELVQSIMEVVLPSEDRWVTIDAPDTVEVVLRRRDDAFVLHLVNRASGERKSTKYLWRGSGFERQFFEETRITDIPVVPSCRVSVRLPARPQTVSLQPDDERLSDWSFEDGRLEVTIPSFAIHQMVVMEL